MLKSDPKILLLSTLVALLMTSCANENSNEVAEQNAVKATPIEAAIVQLSNHDVSRGFTGTLVGEKQAEIHARIAEVVDRVLVTEGQSVKKDQVLIRLDKSGPASTYRNVESLYKNAEKNHEKMKYLYEQGAIAESQYDAAFTEYEVAKASFESVTQLVEIRSPINGVVTSLNVADGDYPQLGAKLVTIAKLENLRVAFGVNTRDVSTISIGDTVMISSSDIEMSVPGEVVTIAQSADPKTRTFEVEAQVTTNGSLLRPGMFVRASVVLKRLRDVIVVPHDAVLEMDNRQTVFVVNNGIVQKHVVKITGEISQGAVIDEGLNVGDTIVTLGQTYLDDGFNVKITSLETNNQ